MKKPKGKIVNTGAVKMHYEEYGVGSPLVLLHGFGGCSQNWHPFVGKLSKRYRLIVVDLRCHGYSTNPSNKFTHREAADDVYQLLEKLAICRFSAIGISSGAMALLHMATSRPECIDSMVLVSATSYFPDQARGIMRGASLSTMPPQVRDMYRECAKSGPEQAQRLIAQFNRLGDDYEDMAFSAESLSGVAARTLLVHGDRDRFFPVDIALNIYRSIPNAALWVVPHGEHVPIYDPTVPFTSVALRFLDASPSDQTAPLMKTA